MSEDRVSTDSGELFDIVDVEDRVIGQVPRHAVHARCLLHRAVHVLIHNGAGHFFLQRRSLAKDTFPGCWDSSCTGHVDAGEDYLSAARRELGEELGWLDRALALRPLRKLRACPETGYEFIQIYLAGPLSGPFTLHPGEISEGRWIAPAELEAQLKESPECFAGSMRHLWRHHRAEILAAMG
ncbi:MAG TPA: NUDIX domain-containing protein [Candidatus Methylacidiphilales bacterium]|nr:NUDIX domain-containing protein [Candidatus Methylacidiphilales bacterium]